VFVGLLKIPELHYFSAAYLIRLSHLKIFPLGIISQLAKSDQTFRFENDVNYTSLKQDLSMQI